MHKVKDWLIQTVFRKKRKIKIFGLKKFRMSSE